VDNKIKDYVVVMAKRAAGVVKTRNAGISRNITTFSWNMSITIFSDGSQHILLQK
jgi:hypothetical protein